MHNTNAGKKMLRGEIEAAYTDKRELYGRAIRQVEQALGDIVKDFTAERLFRATKPQSRLKDLDSIKRKAYEDSLPIDKIFDLMKDIVGVRIVVNNLSDAYKVVEKIKDSSALQYEKDSIDDKIAKPDGSGYRAIHLIVYVDVEYKGCQFKVPCEVQVRTLIQDSWAVLAHDDIYKGADDIPPIIRKLSLRLADQLAVLDQMAQDIRDELAKEADFVQTSVFHYFRAQDIPDELLKRYQQKNTNEGGEPLTKRAIGIVYYEFFGEKPQEYELQIAVNQFTDMGLTTVDDLKNNLPSEEVKRRLHEIHQEFFKNIDIGKMDTLIWGTKAMLIGDRAYSEFKRILKKEWKEIESFARREAISALPASINELIEELEDANASSLHDGEFPAGIWDALDELGALDECHLCGKDILEPYQAYEVLLGYYKIKEKEELLEALNNVCYSGIAECGDADHSDYCPHCAHLLYDDNT
ncbi:MAG: ywaC [Dehalococcoidia bacterium]|nr:ywaC [Dehalococcoidia bacterium]